MVGMKHGSNQRRGRSRGGNGGKRHQPSRNQAHDSNGPEGKVRGSAQQVHDKYLSLARDATAAGEHIAAEGFYQYAEHYYRIVNADGANNPGRNQQPQGDQQTRDQKASGQDTANQEVSDQEQNDGQKSEAVPVEVKDDAQPKPRRNSRKAQSDAAETELRSDDAVTVEAAIGDPEPPESEGTGSSDDSDLAVSA